MTQQQWEQQQQEREQQEREERERQGIIMTEEEIREVATRTGLKMPSENAFKNSGVKIQ